MSAPTLAAPRCSRCHNVIDLRDGAWTDRAGQRWCNDGLTEHQPPAVRTVAQGWIAVYGGAA